MTATPEVRTQNGKDRVPAVATKPKMDNHPDVESLVARNSAVLNDVHGLILRELDTLNLIITETRRRVEEAKNRAVSETQVYIEIAHDTLLNCQKMMSELNKIGTQADKL